MLAAHRRGGRTSFLSFARSWDRFTRAGRKLRPATRRELAILIAQLEASLVSEAPGALGRAIEEHRALRARRSGGRGPGGTPASAPARSVAPQPVARRTSQRGVAGVSARLTRASIGSAGITRKESHSLTEEPRPLSFPLQVRGARLVNRRGLSLRAERGRKQDRGQRPAAGSPLVHLRSRSGVRLDARTYEEALVSGLRRPRPHPGELSTRTVVLESGSARPSTPRVCQPPLWSKSSETGGLWPSEHRIAWRSEHGRWTAWDAVRRRARFAARVGGSAGGRHRDLVRIGGERWRSTPSPAPKPPDNWECAHHRACPGVRSASGRPPACRLGHALHHLGVGASSRSARACLASACQLARRSSCCCARLRR
jgi:hypothetical protein